MIWNLVGYFLVVMVLASAILGLSYVLGEHHNESATGDPYESGIVPTDTARRRQSPRFYLIAVFFVIFDLESAFIFAWSIAFRDLGWAGFLEVSFFIFALLVGLFYLWRTGGLDWRSSAHRQMEEK